MFRGESLGRVGVQVFQHLRDGILRLGQCLVHPRGSLVRVHVLEETLLKREETHRLRAERRRLPGPLPEHAPDRGGPVPHLHLLVAVVAERLHVVSLHDVQSQLHHVEGLERSRRAGGTDPGHAILHADAPPVGLAEVLNHHLAVGDAHELLHERPMLRVPILGSLRRRLSLTSPRRLGSRVPLLLQRGGDLRLHLRTHLIETRGQLQGHARALRAAHRAAVLVATLPAPVRTLLVVHDPEQGEGPAAQGVGHPRHPLQRVTEEPSALGENRVDDHALVLHHLLLVDDPVGVIELRR